MSRILFGTTGITLLALLLGGCGGGGESSDADIAASESQGHRTALAITGQQRASAAKRTAQSSTNACAAVAPFYWEIGAASGKLTSGSVTVDGSSVNYTATTQMDLGSSSKWIYGAYVAQRRNGTVTDMDRKMLTMNGGYTNLTNCYPGLTVNACFYYGDNEKYDAAADGKFYYNGGHLQKHAVNIGLGTLSRQALATEVRSVIGEDINMSYDLAMLAGGATSSPAAYGAFMRKMMSGDLVMGDLLGSNAVCTNPATCSTALKSPTPANESWHYSLAHWVEDDPVVGDGSFSSPGTKGFYPWIDANKTLYGIVARQVDAGNWFGSVECGRLIRKAFKTGEAQ